MRRVRKVFKSAIVSLFVPVILLAITACPGLVVEHITVSFAGGGAITGAMGTFTCISPTTRDVVSYQWSFGDGATAEGRTATHSYASGGEYTVECKIFTSTTVLIFTIEISILSRIVYVCDDGDEEICIINSDGSGFQQLTANTESDDDPWINSSGQIAYLCFDGSDFEICVINFDGTGFKQLTNNTSVDIDPSINDLGQIAYPCGAALFQICIINFNGSGFDQLPFAGITDTDPAINNSGQIVYVCEQAGLEICAINSDGTGAVQLSVDGFANPDINASGQVAFECHDGGDLELCRNLFDQSDFAVLTSSSEDERFPAINDGGLIAYQCFDGSDYEICVINFDGSGFKQLTDNATDDTLPSIQ